VFVEAGFSRAVLASTVRLGEARTVTLKCASTKDTGYEIVHADPIGMDVKSGMA
jgi:hypothetical protein